MDFISVDKTHSSTVIYSGHSLCFWHEPLIFRCWLNESVIKTHINTWLEKFRVTSQLVACSIYEKRETWGRSHGHAHRWCNNSKSTFLETTCESVSVELTPALIAAVIVVYEAGTCIVYVCLPNRQQRRCLHSLNACLALFSVHCPLNRYVCTLYIHAYVYCSAYHTRSAVH